MPLFKLVTDRPFAPDLWTVPKDTKAVVGLPLSVEDTSAKISVALSHQSELERRLSDTRAAVRKGTASFEDVDTALLQCEGELAGVRVFLTTCIDSIPITMRPTAQSAIKAQQVLSTAELVGLIFANLSAQDLLSALQINHTTAGMVSTTPSLQDILHLRPAKDGFMSTLFEYTYYDMFRPLHVAMHDTHTSWITSASGGIEMNPNLKRDMRVVASFTHGKTPRSIGKLCRRMLICQPPVLMMEVGVDCCCVSRRPNTHTLFAPPLITAACGKGLGVEPVHKENKCSTITSQTGLTVGDLHDATLKIQAEHRECWQACVTGHGTDNTDDVNVEFTGDMVMKLDDPYVLENVKQITVTWLESLTRGEKQQTGAIYQRATAMGKTASSSCACFCS